MKIRMEKEGKGVEREDRNEMGRDSGRVGKIFKGRKGRNDGMEMEGENGRMEKKGRKLKGR